MATVSKEFTFEAAHRLTSREAGACAAAHGHSYRVKVTVSGPIDPETGMVMNFRELDSVGSYIKGLDHRLILCSSDPLLKVVGEAQRQKDELSGLRFCVMKGMGDPTAENIALAIFKWAMKSSLTGVVESVTVWETLRCSATVTKEDLKDE